MNSHKKFSIRLFTSMAALCLSLFASDAFAASGGGKGGWSMGLNLGINTADQKDMNSVITAGGGGASKFGNAWEGAAQLAYRFTDTSIVFRPTYIYNKESAGANDYSINGFTFFPILRFHLLEDATIKFYSNLGVGFGWVNGEISEGSSKIEFSGSDFGYLGGLGAEFCFWGDHCINVEGNMRFLSIDRNIVSKVSGSNSNSRISNANKSQELEVGGRDFAISLTGVQGFVGYTMYF